MRCRQAHKLLGPYMDGELAIADSKRLEKHLESCEDCAEQLAFLRGMTKEITTLPAIVPTAEESLRLRRRIREEMADHRVPKPFFRRVQVAAAASILLIATGVGVTWAVLNSRTTQPGGEVAISERGQPAGEEIAEAPEGDATGAEELFAATTPTMVASAVPRINTAGQQYSAADLSNYDNDLDARLDFYSAYWHPMNTSGVQAASMKPLQESLTKDMAQKAQKAGQDPETLKGAVDSALTQSGRENLLPCYAELARLNGNQVWLICLSGPEDYLLFNNPEMVPAMSIASVFGQEGVNNRKALIAELAQQLFPYYIGSPSTVAYPAQTDAGSWESEPPLEDGEEPPAAILEGEEAAVPEEEVSQEEQDFQDFLRRIVTRGNVMDLLSVLEGLNYEQLLMIIQGSWNTLGGGSLDLGDFLVPPKRLWAVDTLTGEVLYRP
jgi:hypothetical protein